MFRRADLVFVTSEKLRQRAARPSSTVSSFRSACDFQSFDEVLDGSRDRRRTMSRR